MALRRVTVDDIRKMNEEYLDCHNYAEVARRVGYSASTVRKYIYKDFAKVDESKIKRFDPNVDMVPFTTDRFKGVKNYGTLCVLSDEEREEIKQLWEEMVL